MSHQQQVHQALLQLEKYAQLNSQDYSLTRLGGLTNLVYKVELADEKLIVRIAGKGTNEYIDRKVEAHNAQLAAEAGVSADIIHTDPASGLMISHCIDNIVTMTPDLFQRRTGSPARAGQAFRKLHRSNKKFAYRFELFQMIDEYLNVLSTKDTELPPGYGDIVKAAGPVKVALLQHPLQLAPCHNDPLCENFLDDDSKMWIVDWEYSGMNDPLWDLGDLSVEAGFSGSQELEMLQAYCHGEPDKKTLARIIIYKAMCDLLWTLWGLIQHADKNPAEDFWAYSLGRFERCKTLMDQPEFDNHISAVSEG